MTEIAVDSPSHQLRAYMKAPEGLGPWPGVVVLHDVVGMSDDCRKYVDWFASSGYLAIAPDLFSWGDKFSCIRNAFRDLIGGSGPTFADIDSTRSILAARKDCTGKVGVIGFCMGGGFALLSAAGHGFSASSINYGMLPKDLDAVLDGACPIIGSFGARDFTLKGAAAKLEQSLERAHIQHDVKEYPDVSHAFMNEYHGALGWITARVGMDYHAPSASDAQDRILEFFRQHLS